MDANRPALTVCHGRGSPFHPPIADQPWVCPGNMPDQFFLIRVRQCSFAVPRRRQPAARQESVSLPPCSHKQCPSNCEYSHSASTPSDASLAPKVHPNQRNKLLEWKLRLEERGLRPMAISLAPGLHVATLRLDMGKGAAMARPIQRVARRVRTAREGRGRTKTRSKGAAGSSDGQSSRRGSAAQRGEGSIGTGRRDAQRGNSPDGARRQTYTSADADGRCRGVDQPTAARPGAFGSRTQFVKGRD